MLAPAPACFCLLKAALASSGLLRSAPVCSGLLRSAPVCSGLLRSAPTCSAQLRPSSARPAPSMLPAHHARPRPHPACRHSFTLPFSRFV
ncbi:hypothetical protein C6T69_29740 [Burkholderia multivorans]|nr:hypothetical protein C6T69_29740 [Burkholderia multivorans]